MTRAFWTHENPLWGYLAVGTGLFSVALFIVGGWYFRPCPKQPERLRKWHL